MSQSSIGTLERPHSIILIVVEVRMEVQLALNQHFPSKHKMHEKFLQINKDIQINVVAKNFQKCLIILEYLAKANVIQKY